MWVGLIASVTTRVVLRQPTGTSSHPATTHPIHGPGLTFGQSRWWSLFRRLQTVTTSSSGSISTRTISPISVHERPAPKRVDYLFVGPNWTGETPAGITKVLRAETEIIGTLTRTSWSGPADRDGLVAMQQQYRIRPLSEFAGGKPPPPAPTFQFPAWDEARANSIGFIDYLNFLLRFAPAVDSEKTMMERFAKIGIGPGRAFDPATIEPKTRAAIEAGIKDGAAKLQAELAKTTSSVDLFGTRAFLGSDYVMRRAVGAAIGIYGNSKEEAYYTAYSVDANKQPLDGSKRYVLRFSKGQVPPVKFFWSMTMYNLPDRLLVDNPIQRYAIGSRTQGLKTNADGSVDIYLQSASPGGDKESNWLPTPKQGPFFMVLRMYGPEGKLAAGEWQAPQPTAVD